MYNQYINQFVFLILSSFLLVFLNSCGENITELNSTSEEYSEIHQTQRLLIPDTYVEGYVYLDESPINGATVYLLDENYDILTQTTTSGGGFYSMCICIYGYGDRTVKAVYTDRWNNTYMDSESFTFSAETGYENDWLYVIDLFLQIYK